ncbi:MAG: hypothetical protein JHC74_06290 [Thermoleophilia bacterium]|nr:hypothetical protein [Thermoleophilia bacterium]
MRSVRTHAPRRGRRRAALALVALVGAGIALAGAPAGAQAALAGLQDDRISVDPESGIEARADLLARSRTRVSRVDLLWSEAAPTRPARPRDPDDPAYRFARWDRIAAALTARGIRPIFTIYSSPAWAAGGRRAPAGRQVNPNAPAPAAFAAFVQAVATRYSGRFTDPATGRPIPQVRHLEMWNEPNLAGFLRAGSRVAPVGTYVRMVRAAYPAVHRGNRRAVVIVGAGGPRSSTDRNGISAESFQRSLLRAKVKMDAFSQHVYPAAGPLQATRAIPAWRTLPVLLDALERARPRTPFLITEAGYTTARTPFRTVKVSPAQQARFLRQIFALPAVRTRVALVVWYQMEDNPNWPGGLLRAGGSRKPSWAAFQSVARRGPIPVVLRR